MARIGVGAPDCHSGCESRSQPVQCCQAAIVTDRTFEVNCGTGMELSAEPVEVNRLLVEPPQLQVGALLGGRYRVVAHIGTGGMGEVYRVEHVLLGRLFAAKVLKRQLSAQPRLVARFEAEVRAMARLRSDHLTRIVDSGKLSDGSPYLVMDLLEGSDLRGLLERVGSLAPQRAIELAIDACWGLRAVHHAGLVHRDVKPSNLFLTRSDSRRVRCVLLDFGVAKVEESTLTHGYQLVGTLKYMAPEQLESGVVDARSDLYSLGIVIYRCLAGQAPHSGATLEQVLYSIMNKTPPPLRSYCPEISEELSSLVARAMARDPRDRFPDAASMAQAFSAFEKWTPTSSFSDEGSTHSASVERPHIASRRSPHRTKLMLSAFACAGLACTCFAVARRAAKTTPAVALTATLQPAREKPTKDRLQHMTMAAASARVDETLASTAPISMLRDRAKRDSEVASKPASRKAEASTLATGGVHGQASQARQQTLRKPAGVRTRDIVADISVENPYDE